MSFESLFLTLMVFLSGYPFEIARWVVDPWPLHFLLPLLVLVHHLSIGFSRRVFEREFLLASAFVLLTLICCFASRGPLILSDYWICLWLLTGLHWFCLSRDEEIPQARLEKVAYVPLVLLPLVLFSLASLEPASAGQFLSLIICGAFIASSIRGVRNENLLFRHLSRSLPALLLLIFPLVAVLSQFINWGQLKEGVVLFDCFHQSTASVEIDLRANEQFAEASLGHGRFLHYVRSCGYETRLHRQEITPKSLEKVSIVVLLMNSSPMKLQERQALISFVRRGGGLLVVGDHTDVEGTSSALNPLIKAFGAQFAFDTVWRRLDAGVRDVRFLAHPLTCHLQRAYFSTGCSINLDCCSPLRPFIRSSSMLFSDLGHYGRAAYLGDGQLNEGERLGSLPLAVAGSFGKGRVVLLGDSAYFQNGVMVLNESFANRILGWLNRRNYFNGAGTLSWLISFITILALCVLLIVKRCQMHSLLPLLFFGVAFSVLFSSHIGTFARGESKAPQKSILLDLAHGNRCHFFWNSTATDMAYDSMDVWLREMSARNWKVNFLERRPLTGALLSKTKVLTIVHPHIEYTESELAAISAFLQNGGSVLLFIGPEKGGARKSLLPALGLTAQSQPLGFHAAKLFAGEFPLEVYYGDGPWPEAALEVGNALISEGPVIPAAPVEVSGALVAARALGRPFIVYGTKFNGKIVLVGDRLHFSDYAFIDGQGKVDQQRLSVLSAIMDFVGGQSK